MNIPDKSQTLKQILFDLQESHKLEITELERKYVNMTNDNKSDKVSTPDHAGCVRSYKAMRAVIDKLLEGKYNLMRDLAKHYNLSEKQVKFLLDSAFLDSFGLSLCVSTSRSQFNTPCDLLMYGDNICLKVKERVEEVEQQLKNGV